MKRLLALSLSALWLGLSVGVHAPAEAASASPATSTARTVLDSGWKSFSVGSRWQRLGSFHSDQGMLLTITDAFCTGDVFAVRDNGQLLGTTPAVPSNGCRSPHMSRPWRALAEDAYSHGTFMLRPGVSHEIHVRLAVNPFGGAGAYYRLDSPGPMWGRIHSTIR